MDRYLAVRADLYAGKFAYQIVNSTSKISEGVNKGSGDSFLSLVLQSHHIEIAVEILL